MKPLTQKVHVTRQGHRVVLRHPELLRLGHDDRRRLQARVQIVVARRVEWVTVAHAKVCHKIEEETLKHLNLTNWQGSQMDSLLSFFPLPPLFMSQWSTSLEFSGTSLNFKSTRTREREREEQSRRLMAPWTPVQVRLDLTMPARRQETFRNGVKWRCWAGPSFSLSLLSCGGVQQKEREIKKGEGDQVLVLKPQIWCKEQEEEIQLGPKESLEICRICLWLRLDTFSIFVRLKGDQVCRGKITKAMGTKLTQDGRDEDGEPELEHDEVNSFFSLGLWLSLFRLEVCLPFYVLLQDWWPDGLDQARGLDINNGLTDPTRCTAVTHNKKGAWYM